MEQQKQIASPRPGRKSAAEYQRAYRERKRLIDWRRQTNWMLDHRLTEAIRCEAAARKLHESQLVEEILHRWYEARFGGALSADPWDDVAGASQP